MSAIVSGWWKGGDRKRYCESRSWVEVNPPIPMGPLALQDLVGLDVTYAGALSVYEETGDPKFLPPVLMKKMIAAGWLGRKTSRGFYLYDDQGKIIGPNSGLAA